MCSSDLVLVDVEGEGVDAKFTFRGQKNSAVPDMPPFETADLAIEPQRDDEGNPEGPDDSEGPVDVPRDPA